MPVLEILMLSLPGFGFGFGTTFTFCMLSPEMMKEDERNGSLENDERGGDVEAV